MVNLRLDKDRRLPQFLWAIGIGGLLIAGGSGIHWWSDRRPAQPPTPLAPPIVQTVSALGRLEPQGEVIEVFAPTAIEGARVETLNVVHGQQIRKGEIIALLDTYASRAAALEEAQAQVAVARSRLQQVQAGAKTGQIQAQARVVDRLRVEEQTETAAQLATLARLQAELRNAELEDQRYRFLQTEGAVSASLRDSKQLIVDTARQRLNEAQAQLNRIQQSRQKQIAEAQATLNQIAEVRPVDVAVARSQLEQAEAAVARAAAELALTVVRSPQDGQVLKINTRPGEVVGNRGVISLGQTQRMIAVAEVYELDVSRVRVGQLATAISKNNAFPDILRGKVVEVGLEINKQDVLNTDPAAQFDARVVEVKVLLDEPSSRKVAGLTNLSLQVEIEVAQK